MTTLVLRIICLCAGTICVGFYLFLMAKGAKYDAMIDRIPNEGYSDKELLAVGYALQEYPAFGTSSPVYEKIKKASDILHSEKQGRFAEFWARLYWARTLSMSLMAAAFGLCLAAWMNGLTIIVVLAFVVVAVYLFYNMGVSEMSNQLKKRGEACMAEFSNMVSKLALLMNCNMTLSAAWRIVSHSKEGEIYSLMRQTLAEMDNGTSDSEALQMFAKRSYAPEIMKFATMVTQGIDGGADVAQLMRQQSRELWAHRRQLMLQKGDAAAAKLLAPTMIVLFGVIIIVVVAAFSGMNFNF